MDEDQLRELVAKVQDLMADAHLSVKGRRTLSKLKAALFNEICTLIEESFVESISWCRSRGLYIKDGMKQHVKEDFADLKFEALKEAIANISEFQPELQPGFQKHHSFRVSFKVWIKYELRLNYNLADFIRKIYSLRLAEPPISEESRSFEELLPCPRPAELEVIARQEVLDGLRLRIIEDHDRRLRDCCIPKYKHCTAQAVCLLTLKHPDSFYKGGAATARESDRLHLNLEKIAEALSVPYRSAFFPWWSKHCKPLLKRELDEFWNDFISEKSLLS